MKLKMDLYLNGIRKIKRTIQVNDNISLQDFCKYVIFSMNGNCNHLYQLTINDEYSYLGPTCYILDYDCEEMMEDQTLEDITLDINDKLMVNYDFKCDWEFILKVTDIEEGYDKNEFIVTSGKGCGILEDCGGVGILKKIINNKINDYYKIILSERIKRFDDYDANNFDVDKINEKIKNEFAIECERNKPKHYIFNISLEEYGREIKRKMSVDSNITLDQFCRCVIVSMRGDLSHPYTIKMNKNTLDESMANYSLSYLNLKEKNRFKVIYDFGDNWVFNITVSKINEGYAEEKRVKVLSGKGYGIVDDCGGPWGLSEIFDGTSEYWEKKDINDFNLEEINNEIDMQI